MAGEGGEGAGSGVPPRGAGPRSGMEETELLLFEWVWGQS